MVTGISAKSKRREVIIFLICFAAAFILNIVWIVVLETPAREIFTKIHIVSLLAGTFYMAVIILRVLYYLLSRLWIRKR